MRKIVSRLCFMLMILPTFSGCASMMMTQEQSTVTVGRSSYETVDTDSIIAFGKVAQDSQLNGSLVFVGLKNSYLITQGQSELMTILNNFSENEVVVNRNAPIRFTIQEKKDQPTTLTGQLSFDSVISPKYITAEQVKRLTQLGFKYLTPDSYRKTFAIEVAVYPPANNLQDIANRFQQSRQIVLQRYHPPGPTITNPVKILWPAAIAFDVITAPAQAIIIPIMLNNMTIGF